MYFIAIILDLTFLENVFGLNQVMAALKFCLIIYEYDSLGKFSNHFPNFHFKSGALPREMGNFFPLVALASTMLFRIVLDRINSESTFLEHIFIAFDYSLINIL